MGDNSANSVHAAQRHSDGLLIDRLGFQQIVVDYKTEIKKPTNTLM